MSDISWSNQKRKLGELKPWIRNPRQINKDQAKRLSESFDEFGQVETIAVGPDNEVYNGHQRLSVLLDKHGKDYEVEVRVSSRALTEKEREKLTVFLHKGAAGEWNFDVLANEFEVGELVDCGFAPEELGIEIDKPVADAEPQIDKAAELNEKWKVRAGDLWQIGEHRLLCGDSTKREDVELVMQGEKADICFTSPPYNVGENAKLSPHQDGGSKYINDNDNKSDDEYLSFLIQFIGNAMEYSEYSFINVQSIAGNKIVLIDLLYELKSIYADTLIWDKMNAQPAMAENVLNSQFEYVHVFSKKGNRAIGSKSFRGTISNVVSIHKQASETKEHNATFSIEFASYFVDKFSIVMVYEPFCGSGTTMVACQNLSRKCRAIEISPNYCAVILERMATAFPELTIERIIQNENRTS